MLVYMVMETTYSDYLWRETQIIKWFYDGFDKADKKAKELYKNMLEDYKSEWNYDNVDAWDYELLMQANWGGQELAYKAQVIELEFEMNSECEIEI